MSADGSRYDDRIEQLRVPPQSVEAEQAVLGGLMLVPSSLANVADLLTESDFYRRDHQLIYRAIVELAEKSQPFDAVTLGEWFESQGLSEQVNGGAYLVELASTTPSAANVRAYAKIVASKALLRSLIDVGTGIVNDGFVPDGREADDIVAQAAAKVSALTIRGARDGGLKLIRSGLGAAMEELQARYNGSVDIGLSPPWSNVRQKLPGLEDTDLLVLAGRPGMGKSVVGMEWADYAASIGRNVAAFSLEMSAGQLTTRLLSRRARVDQELMRRKGGLNDEQWSAISSAARDLRALPLAIDDTASMTIDKIRARASRMHAKVEGGLGLIVVDYLQLIEGGTGREDKRHEEVAKISRGLKQLAKDLRCPVIALSQLNRSLETRTDKRPVMADLRESGAIEQDADIIVFIYRNDYYHPDASDAGVAEFIIGKQRNGPTGTVFLRHHLACSYFDDYHGPKPRYAQARKSKDSAGFDDELPFDPRSAAAGDTP